MQLPNRTNINRSLSGELDYRVMRHAFDSQNDLGRLADERIYQADLCERLICDGIAARRELEVTLSHEQFSKSLFLDLVVAEQGVYELKVVKAITEPHVGQLLTYLHLLDLPRGKILNFGCTKVEGRFVNAPLRTAQRMAFQVIDEGYDGTDQFKQLTIGLLRDWGTSLTLSLYQEALNVLMNKVEPLEVMLPLSRNGVCLGNQRFHLASADSAFKLTAFSREADAFEEQLSRLIQYSPLKAIHWVNVDHEQVTLKTVRRQ